jgi:two-component system LytT family response regulator
MLRVILVDDEPLARQGLREMLGDIDGVEVVGDAASVKEATPLIATLKPDALFLDIMMPGSDGFSLLAAMESRPPVVFVTAHAEYAVKAFDFDAVDYLLKPVRPARLGVAVKRLLSEPRQPQAGPSYAQNDRICLRTPERTLVAPLGDLLSLEAEGDFTRATVVGENPLLICRALGHFEKELPSPPFQRLDRSLIMNLERVHSLEITPSRGARVFLQGITVPITLGRSALKRLREALPSLGTLS